MILEYVDNLISNNTYEKKPSFIEKHGNKILGAASVGAGLAGAYYLNKALNNNLPAPSSTPSIPINEPSLLRKVTNKISNTVSDLTRPKHISELSQTDRLSRISNLEQYKAMSGDSLNNQQFDSLNKELADLHRYSDYRMPTK